MDEEDVVYEGSALYEHLQATGFTDFNVDTRVTKVPDLNSNQYKNEENSVNDRIESMSIFCDSSIVRKKEFDEFRCRICSLIFESNLLNDDDLLFLEHFSPSSAKILSSNKQQISQTSINPGFSISFASLGMLVLVISILVGMFTTDVEDEEDIKSKRKWQLVILAVLMTIIFISLRIRDKADEPYKKAVINLANMLSELNTVCAMSSSSLRILQETYLISKGFVLVTGSGKLNTGQENEPSYSLSLRESLTEMFTSVSFFLEKSHNSLLRFRSAYKYPLLTGLFTHSQDESDKCLNLKKLKIQKDMVRLQISTILTEFLIRLDTTDSFCQFFISSFDKIFDKSEFVKIENSSGLVNKNVNYIKSYWNNIEQDSEKIRIGYEDKKKDVTIAIHSLNLHLQAALHKVQSLENYINAEDSNQGIEFNLNNQSENEQTYQHLIENVNKIKGEIDLGLVCLDETQTRIDKKFNHLREPVPQINEKLHDVKADTRTYIPAVELQDPVIKDEVFEAIIDTEYIEENNYDDDDWYSDAKKERQKIKSQKAQGKRVLKELQPILTKRREVWEERETLAIKRMQNPENKELEPTFNEKESKVIACNTTIEDIDVLDPKTVHKRVKDENNERENNSFETNSIPTVRSENINSNFIEANKLQTLVNVGSDVNHEKEFESNFKDLPHSLISEIICDAESNSIETDLSNSSPETTKEDDSQKIESLEIRFPYPEIHSKLERIEKNLDNVDKSESAQSDKHLTNFNEKAELGSNFLRKHNIQLPQQNKKYKTSPANLQSNTDELYDSDEERLELYRKVKSELDKEEFQEHFNGNQIESSEFNIKNKLNGNLVKNIYTATEFCSQNEDFYDSDNERLNNYYKVKDEMDKEEKEGKNALHMKNFAQKMKEIEAVNTDEIQEIQTFSESTCDNRLISDKFSTEPNSVFVNRLVKCDIKLDDNDCTESSSSTELQMNMNSTKNKLDWSTSNYQKSDTYENTDFKEEKDVSKELNWDLPPAPLKETLKDRINLISNENCLSFQAQVASQAVAASRNISSLGTEECFGGIGDGVTFGDSSDDDL